MNEWLSQLGEKWSGGASGVSLRYEGLSPGWALLMIALLAVAAVWVYRGESDLTRRRRLFLATMRALLLGGIVLFLTRPVVVFAYSSVKRGELPVVFDASASMGIKDVRIAQEDRRRVSLAGLSGDPSRWDLVKAVTAKLGLWTRLHAKNDLVFLTLGRGAHEIGPIGAEEKDPAGKAQDLLAGTTPAETATALGSGLREVIEPRRGRPLAGIVLITDGANNSGFPPLEEAAKVARDGTPLFIYGVGVTDPQDVAIVSFEGPASVNVRETTGFKTTIKGVGKEGAKVVLRANGRQVDERSVDFNPDGESEVTLEFAPDQIGLVALEASVAPRKAETFVENNIAKTRVRVVDEPLRVLLVEQEPRWDFQYLASMLERDRRILPEVVLLDGDPGLEAGDGSIFLGRLPDDRAKLFNHQVIILGDVDPARLGTGWMKLLAQWVGETGGGLIFHAGPRFDPRAYAATPLAPLLPVEPLPANLRPGGRARAAEPVPMRLTPAGRVFPALALSDQPKENEALWKKFPGARWVAPVRAKPSARVYLTWGVRETPVIVGQDYGAGQTVFIGTDETYFWRSKVGEKYYTRLWGQMLETLSSRESGSGLTRLRVDVPRPVEGETVTISGRVFRPGYEQLNENTVAGTLTFEPDDGGEARKSELSLQAIPGRPGEFRTQVTAGAPGTYRYVSVRDPKNEVIWFVSATNKEQTDTAMNAKLLEAMAVASGGRFLREEDLQRLPDWIAEASMSAADTTFQKRELGYSPWLLAGLLLVVVAEWIGRRLSFLK